MRWQRGGGMLRWDERQWQLGGGALPSRLSLAVRGRRRRQRQSRPSLCQIRGGAARRRPRRGGPVAAEGRGDAAAGQEAVAAWRRLPPSVGSGEMFLKRFL
uniref:Uncharacterized protein n=1 Tax=Oryza glaberrima TaxID=4538 RepID=I1PX35_ORYGL